MKRERPRGQAEDRIAKIRDLLPDAHAERHPFTSRDVPILVRLLRDPDVRNRCDALVGLARLGDRSSVPAMVRRLKDASWIVRCEAAEALGAMGDDRAVSPLRRALGERNPHVRYYAAVSLGDLKAHETRHQLESLERSRNPSDHIAAAGALYLLTGKGEHLEKLGRYLREAGAWHLRYAALNTLEWVMRRRDLPKVKTWARRALRREKESPGLRKDLRRILAQP